MNPWWSCYYIPTLHHCPYLHSFRLIQWLQVIVSYLLLGWLVKCHMSWPFVYRVATHVQFTLELCNLRSLLCPSQPQYCYRQVGWVSWEPPALWFALLPLMPTLCIENSACLLRSSNPLAQPKITFIVLSMRSVEDTQWKQDPWFMDLGDSLPGNKQGSRTVRCSCITLIRAWYTLQLLRAWGWEWPWHTQTMFVHICISKVT